MSTQPPKYPHQIIAEKLPDVDPEERRRLLAIVRLEFREILQQRLVDIKAREREWRRKQPGEDSVSRGIRKAERRVERRMLAVMERELKAELGAKTWTSKELKRLTTAYRRLKAGQGLTGVTTGKRRPPPADPYKGLKIPEAKPGGSS